MGNQKHNVQTRNCEMLSVSLFWCSGGSYARHLRGLFTKYSREVAQGNDGNDSWFLNKLSRDP